MKLRMLAPLAMLLPYAAAAQQPVFDTHVHLWNGEKSIEAYEAQLRDTGQTMTRFGGILMATAGQPDKTRKENDDLLALAKAHPQLVPIPSVHPYDGPAAIEELRRLAGKGVSAIKLHPHTQQFDVTDARVLALCKEAGTLGIVVILDNANIIAGDSENLFNLAVKASKTTFIFTHMGAMNFRFWNTILLARTAGEFYSDNIHFDISATVTIVADSPLEEEFVWTMRNIGIDRIVLGSDYPQFSLAKTVDALDRLDLEPAERDKIRYDNARRLLLRPAS
ncbi:amidohydrolase family protein [Sphingopyxis panaciterrae]